MLNTAGLRLDQAPPIGVPFGFFLAAPPFALAAGGLLAAWGGPALAVRWTPEALALTHLLALGFMTQIMAGALLQMLPVLAGSPVPRVRVLGRATQALLVSGTLALAGGLAFGGRAALLAGALALGLAFAIFGAGVGVALARARGVADTLWAMRLSVGALAVTVGLGLTLVAVLLGWVGLASLPAWVDLHLGWGLLGWAGLLILGVGYQVVPMFHVTPAYPVWPRRLLVPLATAGLVAASGLLWFGPASGTNWGLGLAGACFVAFALLTLERQTRRLRPRIDATLLYWRGAMLAALLAFALWLWGGRPEAVGVLLLVGVGVALPSGMLLKIMPFLCWFHLQHRQLALRRLDLRIPHMHAFIPERSARVQFGLHLAALGLLVAGAWPGIPAGSGLARAGGMTLAVASGWQWWLALRCAWRYRLHRRQLG